MKITRCDRCGQPTSYPFLLMTRMGRRKIEMRTDLCDECADFLLAYLRWRDPMLKADTQAKVRELEAKAANTPRNRLSDAPITPKLTPAQAERIAKGDNTSERIEPPTDKELAYQEMLRRTAPSSRFERVIRDDAIADEHKGENILRDVISEVQSIDDLNGVAVGEIHIDNGAQPQLERMMHELSQ